MGNPDNISTIQERLTQKHRAIEEELKFALVPGHPKLKEAEEIAVEARSILKRTEELRTMDSGYHGMELAYNKLNELYRKSMDIRSSMLQRSVEISVGKPLESLAGTLDRYKHMPVIGPIAAKFLKMARGLAVDPTAGRVPGNLYYDQVKGETVAKLGLVDAEKAELERMKKENTLAGYPELQGILQQLERGFEQLEAYNPLRTTLHKRAVELQSLLHTTNYKPLRFFTAITAGLLSGVGLVHSLATGNEVTWPTAGWGIAAVAILYPNLLQDADITAIEKIKSLNTPRLHAMRAAGVTGDLAVHAFEEAQAMSSKQRTSMQQLAGVQGPLSLAQLGALTDGKNTPLLQLLKSAPTQVQNILETFSKRTPKGDQQYLAGMLKDGPVT